MIRRIFLWDYQKHVCAGWRACGAWVAHRGASGAMYVGPCRWTTSPQMMKICRPVCTKRGRPVGRALCSPACKEETETETETKKETGNADAKKGETEKEEEKQNEKQKSKRKKKNGRVLGAHQLRASRRSG